MTTTRIIEAGGVALTVDEAGAGGRPLLLVHGFTGARIDFDMALDPLAAQGWHVVVPDQRGHGESTKLGDEGAYSFDLYVDDLLALVDTLGWDELVLLGHSMGGMIAQTLVLRAPERVRGLILMDTTHKTLRVDAELVDLGITLARDHGLETLVELQRGVDDPLATEAHKRMCATVEGYAERGDAKTVACDPCMYIAMITAITSPHDRLDELRSVACPTLVIVGEQDGPFLKPSMRMAETIPNAELRVIADAGHSPQFENPAGWWDAVNPFLAALA